MTRFEEKLSSRAYQLRKSKIEILQVNMGQLCNMTCSHCHLEAGPTKKEKNMNRETAEAVIRFLDAYRIKTLDLTGGAPELNPNFRFLVVGARRRDVHVMDRSNLTVFFEDGQSDLSQFLKENKVEIIASMPCYLRENVDQQRGKGAYDRSIESLKMLNRLGYGCEGSELRLNLVYNPVGPHLPPPQEILENDYKKRLSDDHGIVFNRLLTIANMPITRYASFLEAAGHYTDYVDLLVRNFNSSTLDNLMCRNTLSVGWDGALYDCDFNLALDMKIANGKHLSILNVTSEDMLEREILTGNHCFACTAGTGSSCQGALHQVSQCKG